MPYVVRDESGNVTRASLRPLVGGEELPHNHPEIFAFLISHRQDPRHITDALAQLQVTDTEMTHAIEEIITLLLKKNVFKMSDLPRSLQDRLALRNKLRTRIEEAYDRASRD